MKMNTKQTIGAGVLALLLVGVWLILPASAQTRFTLRPQSLAVDDGTKTGTAVAGAVTLNKSAGVITSEALTTIAGATYTLTLTNSQIAATDTVFASVWQGTGTTGTPAVATVKPAAGSVSIVVQNIAASAVFNGTIKVGFMTLKN